MIHRDMRFSHDVWQKGEVSNRLCLECWGQDQASSSVVLGSVRRRRGTLKLGR